MYIYILKIIWLKCITLGMKFNWLTKKKGFLYLYIRIYHIILYLLNSFIYSHLYLLHVCSDKYLFLLGKDYINKRERILYIKLYHRYMCLERYSFSARNWHDHLTNLFIFNSNITAIYCIIDTSLWTMFYFWW